ncbi:CaiB/BaiF CoA transferase family protein [Aquisediminimonas sediminicola]|uniref:CaiB/BaiF CoA transferase family protein n=1 Tax=Alteraquisediminimonas sediminicola TaxID=2676787 RepID=UPI001C8D05C7|nr:CaiB/BaiF CoA-transferase family protein [Aquisediminimonas sediminicola]
MSIAPPLAGLRIIELAGIGPGPFCGMMLADHGAEVIRIDRPGGMHAGVEVDGERDVLLRSRRSISLDLKSPAGVEIARRLVTTADGFIEGFRPGVTERLGLGPDTLLALNPQLVYGRMTGWGQDGPYAALPGHDINYIAVSGVLDSIGRKGEAPLAPLNLLGDFGGGGLLLAFGMVTAILAARGGAPGRVIDCSMTEGASALMAGIWTLKNQGLWQPERGSNLLDSGAPFYDSYATADGRYVALGAIEGKFYTRLCDLLGFADDPDFARQHDQSCWEVMRMKLTNCFRTQSLDYWCALFAGEDVCFSPVISLDDAPHHQHNVARGSFIEVEGVMQPAPVPRFLDTKSAAPRMWRQNSDKVALLTELGFDQREIEEMAKAGAFGLPQE